MLAPLQIIIDRLIGMGVAFVAMLPQLGLAAVMLVATWFIARLGSSIAQRLARRSRVRPELVELAGNLTSILVWFVGILVAATIALPNMTPTKLLAGIGIGSVAIGFAFKDVFENFLAGILVLFRDPMRIGDFIHCEGIEGKVERISIRDTLIRQTDGQLLVVPNSMLFKNPVRVLTDLPVRRITVVCGVAYGEDVDAARAVIERAMGELPTVRQDRPIEIFAQAFGESSIDFEVTWWSGSTPLEVRRSRDEVVAAVKRALDEAGIEIPFPYRTLTFKEPLHLARSNGAGATPSLARDEAGRMPETSEPW